MYIWKDAPISSPFVQQSATLHAWLLGVAARCERLLLSPTVLDTTCVMNCLWHLCVLFHSFFWVLQVIVLVSPLRVLRANLLSVIGEEGGRQGCGSGSRTRQKAKRCHSNDGPTVQYRAVAQRIWHGLGSNPESLLMDLFQKVLWTAQRSLSSDVKSGLEINFPQRFKPHRLTHPIFCLSLRCADPSSRGTCAPCLHSLTLFGYVTTGYLQVSVLNSLTL